MCFALWGSLDLTSKNQYLTLDGLSPAVFCPRRWTLFWAILAGLLSCGQTLQASITTYLGQPVALIRFVSEDPIDEEKLRQLIPLAPGQPLKSEALRKSLEVLYATRLFEYIEVLADKEPTGLAITFKLRPNYFFADFRVGGETALRSPLKGLSQLPLGDVYSRKTVQNILPKVQENLRNAGYFRAELTPNIQFVAQTRLVYVEFLIDPGPRAAISTLELSGTPVLGKQEILQEMKSKPGRFYDYQVLKKDFERIRKFYSDRGFLNATIRLEDLKYSSEQNSVALNIYVDASSYVYIQLIGAKIPRKKLRDLVPIYEEGSIDNDLILEGKKNIEDYFQRRGHFDTSVESEFIEVPDQRAYQINYTVSQGEREKVVSVEFPGVKEFTEKEFTAALKTKPGKWLNRGTFSRDLLQQDAETLKNMYLRKGFEQVSVTSSSQRTGKSGDLAVSFRVQEGPQTLVAEVATEGARQIPRTDLLKGLTLARGKPFSQTLLEEDMQLILSKYSDQGFSEAKVDSEVRRQAAERVEVVYHIVEGESIRVSDLYVSGNWLTKRKVITRNIDLREGSPLGQDSLLTSQQKLYSLGLFDKVDIVPLNVNPVDLTKPVLVHVEEASPLVLGYGIGYQSWERFRGTFEISRNNLFGLARSITFRTRDSFKEQRAEISYKEPRLFNRDLETYLILYADNLKRVSFDTFQNNIALQVLKRVHRLDSYYFRYNFQTVDLSNILVNPQAVGFPGQNLGTLKLSSLSTAWLRDTRDDPFNPTAGRFNTLNLKVTAKPIGSETNFVSFYGQTQGNWKVAEGPVMAASLRVGLTKPFGSTPEVPISERFFAGGSTTLRGYAQDMAGPLDPTNVDPNTGEPLPLGGNAMIIVNLESRIPVSGNLTFAPFYDTGNVFSRISSIRLSSFTHNLGFGFRYKTPFGPIRLDFGFNLARSQGLPSHQIFFTVGNPF
jgi:outer membrane protein insertion porin family